MSLEPLRMGSIMRLSRRFYLTDGVWCCLTASQLACRGVALRSMLTTMMMVMPNDCRCLPQLPVENVKLMFPFYTISQFNAQRDFFIFMADQRTGQVPVITKAKDDFFCSLHGCYFPQFDLKLTIFAFFVEFAHWRYAMATTILLKSFKV